MNEQAHRLTVLRVLFWTSVWTLQMAEPQLHSLEGQTNSPGMPQDKVRPRGQSLGRNLFQWVEEEIDHLLGLPGREHQIGRPGDLGKGGIVITSE